MHDCERISVQSFVCVKCLISFEVICIKTYNEKIDKCSKKFAMHNLFLAARGAQVNSWHLKKYLSEKFLLFYLLTFK